jgi:hypothetical protein
VFYNQEESESKMLFPINLKYYFLSICIWSLVIFKVSWTVSEFSPPGLPIVINTWGPPFTNATLKGNDELLLMVIKMTDSA